MKALDRALRMLASRIEAQERNPFADLGIEFEEPEGEGIPAPEGQPEAGGEPTMDPAEGLGPAPGTLTYDDIEFKPGDVVTFKGEEWIILNKGAAQKEGKVWYPATPRVYTPGAAKWIPGPEVDLVERPIKKADVDRRQQRQVHLIDVGDVPGIPAAEVKPGMRMLHNYYGESEVVEVGKAGRFVEMTLADTSSRKTFIRKVMPNTIVPAFDPQDLDRLLNRR
jgi:hypothetical protein